MPWIVLRGEEGRARLDPAETLGNREGQPGKEVVGVPETGQREGFPELDSAEKSATGWKSVPALREPEAIGDLSKNFVDG